MNEFMSERGFVNERMNEFMSEGGKTCLLATEDYEFMTRCHRPPLDPATETGTRYTSV